MLVTLGSLSLSFASRMAPQDKEGEMLSTEEWQRTRLLPPYLVTLLVSSVNNKDEL